jgi:hypothetical protein
MKATCAKCKQRVELWSCGMCRPCVGERLLLPDRARGRDRRDHEPPSRVTPRWARPSARLRSAWDWLAGREAA